MGLISHLSVTIILNQFSSCLIKALFALHGLPRFLLTPRGTFFASGGADVSFFRYAIPIIICSHIYCLKYVRHSQCASLQLLFAPVGIVTANQPVKYSLYFLNVSHSIGSMLSTSRTIGNRQKF